MNFVSARDGFYRGVFLGGGLLFCLAFLMEIVGPPKDDSIIGLIISLPVIAVMVSIYMRTYYEVSEDHLVIHFGPFRQTIARDRIVSIRPHRSYYSAPALSRQRLMIRYDTYGDVQVSPEDQKGFIEALGFDQEAQ